MYTLLPSIFKPWRDSSYVRMCTCFVHSQTPATKVTSISNECWGHPALHIASLHNHVEAVKTLLQHNASVNMKAKGNGDIGGHTALHLAREKGYPEIVKVILQCQRRYCHELGF